MKCNELLLYNGQVISMTKSGERYDWIYIRDGKIEVLGKGAGYMPYLKEGVESYDLKGKTVLPGFYDCHVHLTQTGLNILGVDLSEASSIDELLQIIESRAKTLEKGKLIRGIHFDEMNLREKRMPTRRELDSVSPSHPVWINRIEFHTSIVNSLALHMINLPYTIDGIARDERNLPAGFLTGKASAFVRNKIFDSMADDMREEGVSRAVEEAISRGITTVNAMEGGYTFHDRDAQYLLEKMHTFPIDVNLFYQSFDISKVVDARLNRIGGDIFIDGSFGSRTAALSTAYADDPTNFGKLYFQQEEIEYYVEEAVQNGLQVALHAIGDRAIEQALNAYEKHAKLSRERDLRHRIEHFELATVSQIKRAKEMDIIVSMQPAYEYFWGDEGKMYEQRLGRELAESANPFRRIIDEGLRIIGGSDSDVTPMNPMLGIHMAVNHPMTAHQIDVYEAVKMFTIDAAYGNHEEDKKGSLEVGKMGDLVVLEENPFEVSRNRIREIQISATFKEGNMLFSKGL